ncbi:hypothetical protein WN51_07466, partial [Melipona quadrifasciata]
RVMGFAGSDAGKGKENAKFVKNGTRWKPMVFENTEMTDKGQDASDWSKRAPRNARRVAVLSLGLDDVHEILRHSDRSKSPVIFNRHSNYPLAPDKATILICEKFECMK